MKDERKTKAQLVEELAQLRRRIAAFEAARSLIRQAAQQEALLKIGQAVLDLTRPSDLEQVAVVCFETLKGLGLDVQALAIQRTVDEAERRFELCEVSPSGRVRRAVAAAPNLYRIWKAGVATCRKDLDADLEDLPRAVVEDIRRRMGIRVRCILDLPHARGNLALLSISPDAFSEADVRFAEQVGRVLSVGMARAEDLERLEAQNRVLQMSEARYRAVLEALPDMIFVFSEEGVHLEYYAPDPARLLVRPEDFLGKTVGEVLPENVAGKVMHSIRRCLNSGEMQILEYDLPSAAQKSCSFEGRMVALGTREVLVIVRDVTELKQAERDMVRLERLRALGELSAGVSHNLNNILTGIMGPAQLLQRYVKDERVRRDVEDILRSTIRARDLVQRLHQAVRGDEGREVHPVMMAPVVLQAVRDTRPRWKDEAEARGVVIRIEQEVEGVPGIAGTVSGLYDILVNLLLNAVDAMPEGGAISISAREAEEGVRLVVRDTGVGMDEEVRRRIFEPFFTTKRNVGTGLGLSTVYGTVERWGGRIEVDSAPGEGTMFVLWLPVWRAAP